jgi:hypothetical protein
MSIHGAAAGSSSELLSEERRGRDAPPHSER